MLHCAVLRQPASQRHQCETSYWENSPTVYFISDSVKVFDEQTNIWMDSYNKSMQKFLIKKQSNVEAEEDTAAGNEEIIWYWDYKTGLWFS